MQIHPSKYFDEPAYTEEQKRELVMWPVLKPYIQGRKRYNLDDGQPTHGTYDNEATLAREVWICGHHTTTITTLWLASDRLSELPEELQKTWGSYPPLPERKK